MNKYLPYIIVGLLLVLFIQGMIQSTDEITEEDMKFRIQMHDLEQENVLLIKQNNQLEFNIKKFENEILKNDSIIDNASINELDSMFSAYFNR